MKMRQYKILTRTLLILSIINFALTPTAAIRERLEVHLDSKGTRDVTAASQKRWDPLDWGGSPNVPGLVHAPPPSPDLTDILGQMAKHIAEQHRYTGSPLAPPDGPGSLTGRTMCHRAQDRQQSRTRARRAALLCLLCLTQDHQRVVFRVRQAS